MLLKELLQQVDEIWFMTMNSELKYFLMNLNITNEKELQLGAKLISVYSWKI